jgi:hypothetical protein
MATFFIFAAWFTLTVAFPPAGIILACLWFASKFD